MTEYKKYRKKVLQDMAPYVAGQDMVGVSVSPEDTPEVGGMIARAAGDPKDKWYINPKFFKDNYDAVG
jgi:hypothetical protein